MTAPLPAALPPAIAAELAASTVTFNTRAVEAEQARLAASLAAANSKIHEVHLLEQDAANKTAAYRAHLVNTSHVSTLNSTARAALDVDKNSQTLIHTHAQFKTAEDLYTATIAKRNQAETSLMVQNQETQAVRDLYTKLELGRNSLSVEARVQSEKAVATEAGVQAATLHVSHACQAATDAAKSAAEFRVRLVDAESVIETIEAKRSQAAVAAAHAAMAAREALAREKGANEVLESISREAEKARTAAALIRAEANLAEETARVKAAGHAAAKAGLGEAAMIHEEQSRSLADVSTQLIDSQNAVLHVGTELDVAVRRECMAQQELQGSVVEQEKAMTAEIVASDALSSANATLAASEALLRRAGSSEALERVHLQRAASTAAEAEARMVVANENLAFAQMTESMMRSAELSSASIAAAAAGGLHHATESASPAPILSPAGRVIGSPIATSPIYYRS